MEWVLKGCDLNKDVEIQDNCQITLPDIQLKYAGRVFRLYVKSLHDKAVYRTEESLTLNRALLSEALDNITHPHRLVEFKVDELSKQLKHFVDSFAKCNCNTRCINGISLQNDGNDSCHDGRRRRIEQ